MVIELAGFELAEGINKEEFLEENEKFHISWVSQQPGFVSRVTSCDKDGKWKDVLVWQSIEQAQAASQNLMQSPEAKEWMSMMNPESLSMYHGTILFEDK